MLSDGFLGRLTGSRWFWAGPEPYLVLDTSLRIRAVNAAYERATGHPRATLLGEQLFEAFPDNPADPCATGVANLGASLEAVFSRGKRHWMGVQRYDVRNPLEPDQFVHKVWVPINSPLAEQGRVVGALHHVEDVTSLLAPAGNAPVTRQEHDVHSIARSLAWKFPFAPYEAIVGTVAHSCCVVMHVLGALDVERAVELATLRLEVRFSRPAVDGSLN